MQRMPKPFGPLFREVAGSARGVIRAELRLAHAEFRASKRDIGRDIALMAAGGTLLIVGFLPLLAFLVIGLGRVFDDRFWLSALVVGGMVLAVGAALVAYSVRGLKRIEFTHPARDLLKRN
jgi:uncharacterized membrane protein YqjE